MPSLPHELSQAIELEISKIDFSLFSQAIRELSLLYRKNEKIFLTSLAQRLAYIGVRLPATYSAILAVLSEIKRISPTFELKSFLDLGTGPGTALWAILTLWPEINKATLIERDREFVSLGKKLMSKATNSIMDSVNWLNLDLGIDFSSKENLSPHDLVVISYSLGEMPPTTQQKVLIQAWETTKNFLVIIEPGTVKGFQNILSARDSLILLGANIIAPCPHKEKCPITENDWCHFSARVERSSFHRKAKDGTLSYEDEKFSYIIASKHLSSNSDPRIIRHPLKRPKHLHLDLCTDNGLSRITISQKNKELYKLARKLSWGDILEKQIDKV